MIKARYKPGTSVIAQLGIEFPNIQNRGIKTGLFKMLEASPSAPAPPAAECTRAASCAASTAGPDRLVVFTDGACSGNGTMRARAGYAVVWPHNRSLDVGRRLEGSDQTNNRAEYSALVEAQRIADTIDPEQQKPLYVYTDSELLINSITKWLPDWKRNNWKKSNKKPVLNQDLLRAIDSNPRPLIFKHVRAHTGRRDWESVYNDEVDRLARSTIS